MMTIAAAFAATCAAAAAQTPAQQTPPKPPLPNRANNLLPSWLRVRGEFRERAESAENAGFNDARDDLYYLSRLRLNVSTTSKYVVATVQAQDARVARKTVGPRARRSRRRSTSARRTPTSERRARRSSRVSADRSSASGISGCSAHRTGP